MGKEKGNALGVAGLQNNAAFTSEEIQGPQVPGGGGTVALSETAENTLSGMVETHTQYEK